ncbi:hypothetical protein EJD97_014865 [Solanum chilense]|uniref:Uncharacterized protein n=1 Tax=Solanum chilense TaxID=4083 RepID=A0A6N2CBM1_SOLCI|nr:hypothetical protein EJD97_014865 [Solanum chilense]
MQGTSELSQSPSLARTNLKEIASGDDVEEEFIAENEIDSEFSFNDNDNNDNHENQVHIHDDDDEDDFEFAFVTEGSNQFSPISADEIFYNGQIRPIFNRDLSFNDNNSEKVSTPKKTKSNRVSLRKLFNEDRDIASSSSSSEADDLEGISPGTYCLWKPKLAEESPSDQLRKKSNSTGSSSKRWKLRDFTHRSNSEGKDTFVFLTTPFKKREEKTEITRTDSGIITGKVPAVEDFPALRCSISGKDKRKSYLPYRQDLLSFLGNANGLNRNLQHF